MARWCNYYNCWCKDVEYLFEEEIECDLDCRYCEDSEEIIREE